MTRLVISPADSVRINIPFVPAQVVSDNDEFDFISSYVDNAADKLWPVNKRIHDNPELAWKEFIAHETLTEFMKTMPGWKVTTSAYEIETAFSAEYDSGVPGPVVSFNAEYDALPGIGHSCGHNLIATASLSAAIATGAAMKRFGLAGKVILFGTPAEEADGGKIKLLNAGAYKNVDVNLMSHPGNLSDNALVRTAAASFFKVEFFGREAHAAAAPWEGINALDAMVIAYTAISALRQQTKPEDILQGMITNGGSAPNIIHAYTSGDWIVRANSRARANELVKKFKACFEAAAVATGATLKITETPGYDDQVPNWALGRSYRHYFNKLGGDIQEPHLDAVTISASSDEGNVSHAIPSLCPAFKLDCEVGGHNPGFAKAAGTKESFLAALRVSKALAGTAIEVLGSEEYLSEIKEEWRRSILTAQATF
ncbi:Zn-dependent exopeptidase-5 [Coleophoma cylindrospora]|uniref:Peptidase M20 domain-containing protein 2 n=1 Tax=Coleophoma cylindrospora TaxID=1849047 RepID=A0A3D8S856_9HELO|nr:Zn-dependent exopeptidase-5 [Coleophoma cylindrospora]